MLPGIGGGELIVIAVVALIVVGPKDLPKLLRQLGRFIAKMRGMADDFRASFDDMARQSELDDLRKEVEALRSGQSLSPTLDNLHTDIQAISSDISNSISAPIGPGYVSGDYYSPDSDGGHERASDPLPESLATPVEAPVEVAAKPKRSRAKAAKVADTPIDDAPVSAKALAAKVDAPAKPKRTRKARTTVTEHG